MDGAILLDPARFPCHRLADVRPRSFSRIAVPLAARHRSGAAATFAIISHPDAGKTTLTEKLLLFGAPSISPGRSRQGRAAQHRSTG